MIRRPLLLLALIALVTGTLLNSARCFSQEMQHPASYRIKYRSIDRVYLEGGKADGLMQGDRLGLYLGDSLVVTLEVAYASDHSASCRIVNGSAELKTGQLLTVISRIGRVEPAPQDTVDSETANAGSSNPAAKTPRARRDNKSTRLNGSVALQWMKQHDKSGGGLDFSQSTMRFNLRASNLWALPMTLVVRTRGQYDDRSRKYSSGASNSEWDNRIYELSLSYGGSDNATTFQMGRILPRHLTRVGYVDGAAIDRHVGSGWHVGLSGGIKPRWQYTSDDMTLQKYGGYVGYESINHGNTHFEQYAAFAGEYHGSSISRELINLQGSLKVGSGLWFSNQFEIDFNRGWRKERTSASFDLSSVYLNARWRINKQVTVGSSYDTRRNYWTYIQQSLADSLFDDQLRRGARADLYLNLPFHFDLNSQIGYRKAADEADPTISLVFYASKSGIPTSQTRISARYSKFDGPTNDGYNYNVRVTQRFGDKLSAEVANGLYRYNLVLSNDSRRNRWWEGVLRIEAIRNWYADLLYQRNSGDDTDGYTFRAEIGRRF